MADTTVCTCKLRTCFKTLQSILQTAVGAHPASYSMVGSIPDGVTGIFPSSRIMVLGLTQPLTEMSTRNISWG